MRLLSNIELGNYAFIRICSEHVAFVLQEIICNDFIIILYYYYYYYYYYIILNVM